MAKAKERARYRECDSMLGARSGDMVRTSRVFLVTDQEDEKDEEEEEEDGRK
jgi:hypothetical protein